LSVPLYRWDAYLLPAAALLALLAGLMLHLAGAESLASAVVISGLVLTGAPVAWHTIRRVIAGQWASDLIALLAIVTALLLDQPVAGLVIVLMQSGGEALERYAAGRASDAIRALEAAAPRVAHRIEHDTVRDLAADDIAAGDLLLVRPGELLPCDAVVESGRSHVDASRLTGEPVPVSAKSGTRLLSGSANGEGTLTVRALATASESQYAHIVALVRSAQASKAPLQRLADRYASWFTPLTLAVCAVVYLLTGDALRVLAVLVVATPCPLILATPIAIIGGINHAARRQIIVRAGEVLERLERVDVAVFDKTGTLTIGRPSVSAVRSCDGVPAIEVLRLAGGLEQASGHLLARTLVERASSELGTLPMPAHVVESAGRGVTGVVDRHQVTVGAPSFVREHCALDGDIGSSGADGAALVAYVAIDGRLAGTVEYADRVRPEAAEALAELRSLGLQRTMLLSGDRPSNARGAAAAAGIHEVVADLLPEGKVEIVRRLVTAGDAVLMVGDGTNDAPALAAATVGVALAGHGGGVTAEAAGVVVLADDLRRVPEAIRIARRAMRVARQSIWLGLTLSGIAMALAAVGIIPPVTGAVLQEVIDVASILNALRASR
jgi:heavy metal translocating P-type ATPase